jgi:hypothetical protein
MIFSSQIKVNLEDHVDNMVAKIKQKVNMLYDLQEIVTNLWKVNIMQKFIFNVALGKLLAF